MIDPESLRDIHERIKEIKTNEGKLKAVNNKQKRGEVTSFSIAADLVSGTLVGVIMGVILDELFNSRPVFLLLCIMFGVIAGVNIIRTKI